jgi:hypothetical protein
MTNAELIFAAIRAEPGATDAELRQRTGVEPHQQVNQICRRLETGGAVIRRSRPDGRIGNYPGAGQELRTSDLPPLPAPRPGPARANVSLSAAADGIVNQAELKLAAWREPNASTRGGTAPPAELLIIPCSGSKLPGGVPVLAGPSILHLLTPAVAARLRDARCRLAPAAVVDETLLRPAWRRYNGNFYKAADAALTDAVAAATPLVIVSGGYGLLLPTEPIGDYDRQFTRGDWPPSLIEDCLLDLVARFHMKRVLGFFADTTGYAKLIRNVGVGIPRGPGDDCGAAARRTSRSAGDRSYGVRRGVPGVS